jgi:hypothetical protein
MPFRTTLLVLLTIGVAGCSSAAPKTMPAVDTIVDSEAQPGDSAVVGSEAPLVAEVITLEPEITPEATRPPTLVDMGAVEDFRARFEAGQGKTRLVLLLSPT